MPVVRVKDLEAGHVLKKDIFRGNILVLKKQTVLTEPMIWKLNLWGISTVDVYSVKVEDEVHKQTDQETETEDVAVPDVEEIKKIFFNNLLNLGHEHRYGFALNDAADYKWVEDLFIKLMSHKKIYKLIDKLRAWDDHAYQQSFDVFILGALFARKLKFKKIEQFAAGCLLHDIGKLEIPQSILTKSSKLSQEEYELVKKHTIYGYDILKQQKFPEYVANLARYHHERVDGSGYPEGLKNDQIGEEIKAISIVEVYSSLTQVRPYRHAYNSTIAEAILLKECKMVEDYYFYTFFRMLDIFPLNSIVELTTGTQAKVIDTNESAPYLPVLKERDKSNPIEMPLDRSVKVDRIIKF
ncbi:HD-GYP domain-containing protein [Virgibacillus kimchii]